MLVRKVKGMFKSTYIEFYHYKLNYLKQSKNLKYCFILLLAIYINDLNKKSKNNSNKKEAMVCEDRSI